MNGDSIGAETFYIVASYTPLTELNTLVAGMQKAGGRQKQVAAAARCPA